MHWHSTILCIYHILNSMETCLLHLTFEMWDHSKPSTLLWCVLSLVLCLTLCNSMDCSLPGSSVHGDSLGKNTRVDCHFLLQVIFPTQGSNPCLLRFLHQEADSLPRPLIALCPPKKGTGIHVRKAGRERSTEGRERDKGCKNGRMASRTEWGWQGQRRAGPGQGAHLWLVSWVEATRELAHLDISFAFSFLLKLKVLVAQSCPTLCSPMDCTTHTPLSMEFSSPEYWSR